MLLLFDPPPSNQVGSEDCKMRIHDVEFAPSTDASWTIGIDGSTEPLVAIALVVNTPVAAVDDIALVAAAAFNAAPAMRTAWCGAREPNVRHHGRVSATATVPTATIMTKFIQLDGYRLNVQTQIVGLGVAGRFEAVQW
jgi:hypothetical protein